MGESMYQCYLSQFRCMENMLENRKNLLKGFAEFWRKSDPDRVYLIGSGTSFHACSSAAYFLETLLGMEISVVAPTCAERIYGQRPLVIAVSQGGKSTNTVRAVKEMRKRGYAVATLTDPADTPVGNAGDLALQLAADMELVGPKTRGYTATVLMLYLMGLEAAAITDRISGERYEEYIDSLKKMTGQGEEWLNRCREFYDRQKDALKTARHYLFAGKGARGKVAQEDALKILETLCYPAGGYEYEELLHGPACSTDETLALFLYLSGDEDDDRMQRTARIVEQATPNCYLISHRPFPEGDKILYLPGSEEEWLSPFSDVLLGQLIAACLTEELGRQRHPAVTNIFQDMGTKVLQS